MSQLNEVHDHLSNAQEELAALSRMLQTIDDDDIHNEITDRDGPRINEVYALVSVALEMFDHFFANAAGSNDRRAVRSRLQYALELLKPLRRIDVRHV